MSLWWLFSREIEYLKKETQRCVQDGAEASLKEESGQLHEQVIVETDGYMCGSYTKVCVFDSCWGRQYKKCMHALLSVALDKSVC